jgi:hypothetical protein
MRIALLAAAVLLGAASSSAAIPVCSQPASDGALPVLSDCLHLARASVGIVPCAACVCDADGSGATTISDALHCMRFSVGDDVELDCPECKGSTTTTTLPGCASCNDVMTGDREYADLCSLSKSIYDDMKSCPYQSCYCACGCPPGYVCPAVCRPDCCPAGTGAVRECFNCLANCQYLIEMCREY